MEATSVQSLIPNFHMLTAEAIQFPPKNIEQLLLLIDRELVVIRNIPKTLSFDTIYQYLQTYGLIEVSLHLPSISQ
jgi:hypothetical protein